MSDALYEIGEEVECFCNKCGFFGKAKYTDPLGFPHPGCNYTASPLDGSARRIEALEADNAALRVVLGDLADQVSASVGGHSPRCNVQYNADRNDGLNPVCICAIGRARTALATPSPGEKLLAERFQSRVGDWMQACFGPEISSDTRERNHRFLEESLELVQATGCTAHEAHQLVDYVYDRPVGLPHQECGGVMVTLAALCLAAGLDMSVAAEDELARVWTKIDVIREKQAAKPKHSPLPALDDLKENGDAE